MKPKGILADENWRITRYHHSPLGPHRVNISSLLSLSLSLSRLPRTSKMPGQGEISLNNTSEILSLSGGDVYNSSDHDFVTSGDEDTGLGSDRTATPPRLDADAPADNIIPRARRDAAEEARQRTAAYLATENASLEQVRHLYDVVFSDSSCDESGDTSGSFDQLGPTQVPNNNKQGKQQEEEQAEEKVEASSSSSSSKSSGRGGRGVSVVCRILKECEEHVYSHEMGKTQLWPQCCRRWCDG
jgi:hypothetical protein